jgi:hypothetical protein
MKNIFILILLFLYFNNSLFSQQVNPFDYYTSWNKEYLRSSIYNCSSFNPVLEDGFALDSLNSNNWFTFLKNDQHQWDDSDDIFARIHSPGSESIFTANNVVVNGDGLCNLICRNEPDTIYWQGVPRTCSSGMIKSVEAFQEAKYEIICRMQKQLNTYSAFWTWHHDEIDFFDVGDKYNVTHSVYSRKSLVLPGGGVLANDVFINDHSNSFNTYTTIYSPFKIEFFIDNVLIPESTIFKYYYSKDTPLDVNCGDLIPDGVFKVNPAFPDNLRLNENGVEVVEGRWYQPIVWIAPRPLAWTEDCPEFYDESVYTFCGPQEPNLLPDTFQIDSISVAERDNIEISMLDSINGGQYCREYCVGTQYCLEITLRQLGVNLGEEIENDNIYLFLGDQNIDTTIINFTVTEKSLCFTLLVDTSISFNILIHNRLTADTLTFVFRVSNEPEINIDFKAECPFKFCVKNCNLLEFKPDRKFEAINDELEACVKLFGGADQFVNFDLKYVKCGDTITESRTIDLADYFDWNDVFGDEFSDTICLTSLDSTICIPESTNIEFSSSYFNSRDLEVFAIDNCIYILNTEALESGEVVEVPITIEKCGIEIEKPLFLKNCQETRRKKFNNTNFYLLTDNESIINVMPIDYNDRNLEFTLLIVNNITGQLLNLEKYTPGNKVDISNFQSNSLLSIVLFDQDRKISYMNKFFKRNF